MSRHTLLIVHVCLQIFSLNPQSKWCFPHSYWSYLCDFSALDLGSLTVTQLAGRKLACFLMDAFVLPLHFMAMRVCPRSNIQDIYKGNWSCSLAGSHRLWDTVHLDSFIRRFSVLSFIHMLCAKSQDNIRADLMRIPPDYGGTQAELRLLTLRQTCCAYINDALGEGGNGCTAAAACAVAATRHPEQPRWCSQLLFRTGLSWFRKKKAREFQQHSLRVATQDLDIEIWFWKPTQLFCTYAAPFLDNST